LFLGRNSGIGADQTLSQWVVEDILQLGFEVVEWF